MGVKIRAAKRSEIQWINQKYDEVEFVHSLFDRELIAIAEIDGQRAGLGRIVKIDEKYSELGGMYVFEAFRGKGIAGEIVAFLLSQVDRSKTVYCIPFQHLIPFYERYGFKMCLDLNQAPEEIQKKFHWCGNKYANPTSLLIFQPN